MYNCSSTFGAKASLPFLLYTEYNNCFFGSLAFRPENIARPCDKAVQTIGALHLFQATFLRQPTVKNSEKS